MVFLQWFKYNILVLLPLIIFIIVFLSAGLQLLNRAGPLKALHARCVIGACAVRGSSSPCEKQQQSLPRGQEKDMAPWNRLALITVLIPARLLLLFLLEHYMWMVPSPWTWPVKAGMQAEASSSSPTSTRTTRKKRAGESEAGPGREEREEPLAWCCQASWS